MNFSSRVLRRRRAHWLLEGGGAGENKNETTSNLRRTTYFSFPTLPAPPPTATLSPPAPNAFEVNTTEKFPEPKTRIANSHPPEVVVRGSTREKQSKMRGEKTFYIMRASFPASVEISFACVRRQRLR